jgi:hypothetical protein
MTRHPVRVGEVQALWKLASPAVVPLTPNLPTNDKVSSNRESRTLRIEYQQFKWKLYFHRYTPVLHKYYSTNSMLIPGVTFMVPLSNARNIKPVSDGASRDSCSTRRKDNKKVLCNPKAESRFILNQCFSTFVRPRPGKFFFHKTRVRSQNIYS